MKIGRGFIIYQTSTPIYLSLIFKRPILKGSQISLTIKPNLVVK